MSRNMTLVKSTIVLLFVGYVTACNFENDSTTYIHYSTPGMNQQFLKVLEKENISAEIRGDGYIYFSSKDKKRVNELSEKYKKNYYHLPEGRWAHLGMPGLYEKVVEKLEKEAIPVEKRNLGDKRFLVWEQKKYTLRIKNIISEQEQELITQIGKKFEEERGL